ncbi:AsmA family protein [Adhaeribacter soli]|uniref:AsmA-like C-terminal domain-containing protein n=1 Tax=Adhaeribacter soli TaxID=2607655 RepID=A0A5N1J6V8_9BACT|nr:hypothetical protein [Adhaeribacter soli]KAA9345853.1 hypothetical protein F0P94_01865 [Adhaeribacter soli]
MGNKVVRRVLEIVLWLTGLLLLITVTVLLLLQLQPVQQLAAENAAAYLSGKLQADVRVGRFTTDWKNSLVLKDFYLEDQQGDTLIYAGRLGLDLDMFGLFFGKVKVRDLRVDNGFLNIRSTLPDSAYNFGHLTKMVAHGPEKPVDTAATSTLALKFLTLTNFRVHVRDEVMGIYGKAKLGTLHVQLDQFDPSRKIYRTRQVKLENSEVAFLQTRLPKPATDTSVLRTSFREIHFRNVKMNYRNSPAAQRLSMAFGNLQILANQIDLKNARIDLKKLRLENSSVAYFHDKRIPKTALAINPVRTAARLDSLVQQVQQKPINWIISLENLDIRKTGFHYGNYNTPVLPKGIDFNHLQFSGINLKVDRVYYGQKVFSAELKRLQLLEKSGFRVTGFKGDIKMDKTRLLLRDFDLQTSNSRLRESFILHFPQHKTKADSTKTIDLVLRKSTVGYQDLVYFKPELATARAFRQFGKKPFSVAGQILGNTDLLTLKDLSLKARSGSSVSCSGNIRNATNEQIRKTNLQINRMKVSRQDALALLLPDAFPKGFTLPAGMVISGKINSSDDRIGLQRFRVLGSNGITFLATGSVEKISSRQQLNLSALSLETSRQAFLEMLPPGSISPEIQLPDNMLFTGNFAGSSLENFRTNQSLESTYGKAKLDLKTSPNQQFSGILELIDFNLGKFLKQEKNLGSATGTMEFRGKGHKIKTMELHFKARVKRIVYKRGVYSNIRLEGDLNKKIYQMNGNLANAVVQNLGHKLKKLKKIPQKLNPAKIKPKEKLKKLNPLNLFKRKKKKEEQE